MTAAESAQQIWKSALGELQIEVNKSNYATWFTKTAGLSYQDGLFNIGVPNAFVAEYLDKNQRSLIEKVLTSLTHQEVRVQFQISNNEETNPLPSHSDGGKRSSALQPALPLFNPRYSFDSFIVGRSNQLAYAAALEVAHNQELSNNPLFIYSEPGLGKTHLLQAIGREASANNVKVLYIHAEQYANQFMTALREKKTEDFRNKYRSTDMLLVDDVQFFSGKKQTEENFFHTFDDLHHSSRQIALTCDRPPKAMPQLQDRLRSRFEGGLVADIQAPDFDTRLAILQAKAKREGVDISADVLDLIALKVQQNIRALEGSLHRVIAYAKLTDSKITPQSAAQALNDLADGEPKRLLATPPVIIDAVVYAFQLTPSDLRSRKRDQATALARQVAMYLIRQETDCSLGEIGHELGGRSPATVSHAYQKIANDINNDPSLRRRVFEIQERIYFSLKSPACE